MVYVAFIMTGMMLVLIIGVLIHHNKKSHQSISERLVHDKKLEQQVVNLIRSHQDQDIIVGFVRDETGLNQSEAQEYIHRLQTERGL
ncbi:hypothetical protein KP77_33110 [Jeotgalibacillus alimentarius]|uniref:Uncharacterized protein n=1 Tax=Jeotgalibacillus alimentarius TaxID=135826 RepID=A0A0C2QZX3_9BACL|nr:hypothetical protein [Jeotgalibacillus alimentarius]KIL43605.1 hypothetical protein KP77_33110 [Jeotgalibacillus alimentarius]